MAAGCVYGDRQMQTSRAGRGSAADVVWFGTLDAVTMGTTRAISAPGFTRFASVPKVPGSSSRNQAIFRSNSTASFP